jgi:hypothetical protein
LITTFRSGASLTYSSWFLHDSDPWQKHKSVHARFCSAQTQDILPCDFPLHEHTRTRRDSADMFPPIIALTNFEYNLLQVGMQVWFDYHLQKRRFVSIFFVPHSRPKFGILPVWQNHLCLHQWNTDQEELYM